MKGQTFLKVVAILLIIGGCLSILMTILTVVGVAALAAADIATSGTGLYYASIALALVGGVIELVAGIVGLGASRNPERAKGCVIWGILIVCVSIISIILTKVISGQFSFPTMVTSLILPILYVYAAVTLKKSYEDAA